MKLLHANILGKGEPILVLHGFLGSGDNWISLGRKWAREYQVHLIDLRNHGRSFHDDEMNFEVMLDDLRGYIAHYHLDTFHVLGHSMGGKLAMHWAMSFPQGLKKLIIADIAPKKYANRHKDILTALQRLDFERHTNRKVIEEVLAERIKSPAIRQFLMKNIRRVEGGGFAYKINLPVLIESYEEITEGLTPYSVYEGEVLFLRGEHSPYITDEDQALIMAHFPKARIDCIPDAGHWLHAEQPELFYRKVRDFIRS